MKFFDGLVASIAAAGVLSVGLAATAAPITPERLKNTANEPQNWLMNLGSYNGWHYSSLSQINKSNVGGLRVKFMASIGATCCARPPTGVAVMKMPLRWWKMGSCMCPTRTTRS